MGNTIYGAPWTVKDIPPQNGRTAIVTGANSGIGYHEALELGRAGARVIVVSRDPARGSAALDDMKRAAPGAQFELEICDVSSQESIRAFAKRFLDRDIPLDILINNAGVMMLPKRELSVDGFEMQLATNHLGPFLLTGLLIPALQKSNSPRVVAVASLVARRGYVGEVVDFKKESYSPFGVYAESKLANLLFTRELAKRYPWLTAVAGHPGGSATNLTRHTTKIVNIFLQGAEYGALPITRAAVDPNVKSGDYFGPRGLSEFQGYPTAAWIPRLGHDDEVCARYWQASQEATKIKY